jgi:hypothetical protein
MKGKIPVAVSIIFLIMFLSLSINVQAGNSFWREDFNFSSVSDLEAAGWTTTHSSGISFTSNGVVLDGSDDDTAIHYNKITNGPTNWAIEVKSRWLGEGHSGSSVFIVTEKHSYIFMPDGYYDNFAFYYDGSKVKTYEGYQESVNTWMTLRLEKSGNLIEMYYNEALIGTYPVDDTSKVIGSNYVSPWEGNAEYDYVQIWEISGDGASAGLNGSSSSSVFSNPLVIGGVVGGVGVGVGAAVYYFVIAGGSEAAASAGASSGAAASAGASAGSDGGSSSGGGSLIHHPTTEPVEATVSGSVNDNLFADANSQIQQQTSTSPLSGETIPANQATISPLSGEAAPTYQATPNNAVDPFKIQQDTQTQEFQTQQDVTTNKQKTQDKCFGKWDEYLRGSTDSDSTVADSGSGSGSSEG